MIEPCAAVAGVDDDLQRLAASRGRRTTAGARCTCRHDVELRGAAPAARARRVSAGLGDARISFRPVSPLIGRDCSRTNFMPL